MSTPISSDERIRDVKRRHSAELMNMPGVSGVGVAKGKTGALVIAVHLDSDDPEVTARIPKEIEGFAVETIHSGPFTKLPRAAAKP